MYRDRHRGMRRYGFDVGPCRIALGDVAPYIDAELAESRIGDVFDPGKRAEDVAICQHHAQNRI